MILDNILYKIRMTVTCSICNKNFVQQSSVNRHIREVHKEEGPAIISHDFDQYNNKCLEDLCKFSFRSIAILREHLRSFHNKTFEVEKLTFPTFSAFEKWKDRICFINNVAYICSKLGNYYYYNCYRSGKSKVRKFDRLRKFRKKGSCKIGSACTSQIILSKCAEDEYSVTFYKTHYGHGIETKHNRIPEQIRAATISQLINNVPIVSIVAELLNKNSENQFLPSYRINRTLVRNIESAYIRLMEKRHKKSLNNNYKIVVNDSVSWTLKSRKEKYTISKIESYCEESACKFYCSGCKICIHQYTCTCEDFFCEHIHYLVNIMERFAKAKPLNESKCIAHIQNNNDKSDSNEKIFHIDHNYASTIIELEIKANPSVITETINTCTKKIDNNLVNEIEMHNITEMENKNLVNKYEDNIEMVDKESLENAVCEEANELFQNLNENLAEIDSDTLGHVLVTLQNLNGLLDEKFAIFK